MHETDYHEKNSFITLTYQEEFLPTDNSLNKYVLQHFLKRLRKLTDPKKIKYYACGEYGRKELTHRPHYHAIIFGLSRGEKELVERSWPWGMVDIGTVTYQSCRYVAGYVQKKLTGKLAEKEYSEKRIHPPFALQSLGLGKQYCLDNKEQILQKLNITMFGQNVGIPRYYRKILKIDSEKMYEKSLLAEKELNEKLFARGIPDDDDLYYRKYWNLQQHEKNLIAKTNLKEPKL